MSRANLLELSLVDIGRTRHLRVSQVTPDLYKLSLASLVSTWSCLLMKYCGFSLRGRICAVRWPTVWRNFWLVGLSANYLNTKGHANPPLERQMHEFYANFSTKSVNFNFGVNVFCIIKIRAKYDISEWHLVLKYSLGDFWVIFWYTLENFHALGWQDGYFRADIRKCLLSWCISYFIVSLLRMWLLSIWDVGNCPEAYTSTFLLYRHRKTSDYMCSGTLYIVDLLWFIIKLPGMEKSLRSGAGCSSYQNRCSLSSACSRVFYPSVSVGSSAAETMCTVLHLGRMENDVNP